MTDILNQAKENGWVVVDGITYRYRYNEVRKKVGEYWSLVARYSSGKWEVI